MAKVIGPNGEIRPSDPIANAILVAKISVGEAEEKYVDKNRLKGGKARAKKLSPEERKAIAIKAANARWHSTKTAN